MGFDIPSRRVSHRGDSLCNASGRSDNRRILVHGHRGARALRPENTLPAFKYAIGQGVDFLELDVAVTKDNVAVVSHDPMINPDICSGPKTGIPIHTLTLAQLDEYDCGAKQNPAFQDSGSRFRAPASRRLTKSSLFRAEIPLASTWKRKFSPITRN